MKRRVLIALLSTALVLSLAGCRVARAGAKCRGNELGRDSSYVLACRNGRWVRTITISMAGNILRTKVIADGPRLDGVRAIAAADYATCGLMVDSTVKCWGAWLTGNVAYLGSRVPVTVVGLSNVTQIDLGARFGCALIADGTVDCWGGDNKLGQLGDGTTTERFLPVKVGGVANAVQVTAGGDHACARIADGTLKCWGWNGSGELGDGTVASAFVATPAVDVVGISGATDVTAGFQHTCAVLADTGIACWGSNQFDQLGFFLGESSVSPVELFGPIGATGVESNGDSTCATFDDQSIWCWGSGYSGENDVPEDLGPVTAVSPGYANFTCAATVAHRVRCWGSNQFTFLGDARTDALTDVVQLATGWAHTCVLRQTTNVVCWGYDSNGQLGDGSEALNRPLDTIVTVARGG